jgi:WD40 repeat protein
MSATNTPTGTNHTGAVVSLVQLSASTVASGSGDNTTKVWNINSNSLVNTYNGQEGQVNSIIVSPSNELVTGGDDSTVWMWSVLTDGGATFSKMNSKVYSLSVHPFNTAFMVVNIDNSVNVYNMAANYRLNMTITTNRSYTDMQILTPSGNIILAGGYTDVYSYPNGTRLFTFANSPSSAVRLRQLPDNATVVVGRADGQIYLFNSNTSTQGASYAVHTDSIVMLQVTPDLVYLVSAATDNKLVLWTWTTGSLTQVIMHTVILSNSDSDTVQSGLILASPFNASKKNLVVSVCLHKQYKIVFLLGQTRSDVSIYVLNMLGRTLRLIIPY